MINRRADKRLLLPDIQVSVKKNERKSQFISCTPIDVSYNGLAFNSSELILEPLEKIEFQLNIGHRHLSGQGVVCDSAQMSHGTRYGILFIQMEPAIEDVCSLTSLSSNYVRELAITMADLAIASESKDDNERDLNKAWAILCEGISVFRQRLCEQHSNAEALADLFVINTQQRRITLPLLDDSQTNVSMVSVSPQIAPQSNRLQLHLSNGRKIDTVMELLQDLSEAFAYIFKHETDVVTA